MCINTTGVNIAVNFTVYAEEVEKRAFICIDNTENLCIPEHTSSIYVAFAHRPDYVRFILVGPKTHPKLIFWLCHIKEWA